MSCQMRWLSGGGWDYMRLSVWDLMESTRAHVCACQNWRCFGRDLLSCSETSCSTASHACSAQRNAQLMPFCVQFVWVVCGSQGCAVTCLVTAGVTTAATAAVWPSGGFVAGDACRCAGSKSMPAMQEQQLPQLLPPPSLSRGARVLLQCVACNPTVCAPVCDDETVRPAAACFRDSCLMMN